MEFNDASKTFKVAVKDLVANTMTTGLEFDYVINCTGHFSVPSVPDIEGEFRLAFSYSKDKHQSFSGISSFPGQVIHSHDLRNEFGYKHRRVLIIGAG